jgi:flagellar protein FlaG
MDMTISSVGASMNFTPSLDLPHPQTKSAKQRAAAAEQLAVSLPGTGGHTDFRPQELHAAVADLEQVSLAFNKKLQFVVDHRSNEVTVKVIDKETDKVIKVLPPEELQRLHNKLKETIGFLFDERV